MIPTIGFIRHLSYKLKFDPEIEWKEYKLKGQDYKSAGVEDIFVEYLTAFKQIFNTNKATILSRSRKREIAYMRHLLIYVCVKNKIGSLNTIGRLIGNGRAYDHSTVIHAVQNVENMLKVKDGMMTPMYNSIKHLVNDGR